MAKSIATQGITEGDLRQKRPPRVALKRCHQKWRDLFFGVLKALEERDPKLVVGLMEEFKRVGLADEFTFKPDLFDLNPSDEILERVKRLRETIKIASLKGKTRRRIDPGYAILTYHLVLGAIHDLPRKGFASPRNLEGGSKKNFMQRYKDLKERLPKIGIEGYRPPDGLIYKWSRLTNKQIAVNIAARLLGLETSTLKKLLSQARKKWPWIWKKFPAR